MPSSLYWLKIVHDRNPDGDGQWLPAIIPLAISHPSLGTRPFEWVPIPDHHVVQYRKATAEEHNPETLSLPVLCYEPHWLKPERGNSE